MRENAYAGVSGGAPCSASAPALVGFLEGLTLRWLTTKDLRRERLAEILTVSVRNLEVTGSRGRPTS